jgi:hypothetical protein
MLFSTAGFARFDSEIWIGIDVSDCKKASKEKYQLILILNFQVVSGQ